jgi:uncharacterized protein (TIGR03437 family)
MKRVLVSVLGLTALLAGAVAQAATISTTLTVTATAALSGTNIAATGTATLTNGIGSGKFAATLSLTSSAPIPYTITLDSGGLIKGNLTINNLAGLLGGDTTATGSATVTPDSTGTYAGATGSFPSLTGTASGSIISSLSLTFTGTGTITTGGTAPPPGTVSPTITDVLDGAGYTKNIAQGSIFVVKGSNLCPTGVSSFGIPRPTVSPAGVKITFTPTAGGAGTDALLVYTFGQGGVTQLAGILPSTMATGNYNVTVTNGSASAPFAAQVVQRKPTLFTQSTDGSGLAAVQNYISASQYDLNRFTVGSVSGTTISPGRPGQVLIAYGTGLGPLVGGDNTASPVFDFAANGVTVQAIVGGVALPASFAGRAGYAGEDQINFTLPANVPTGCTVSFQLSVNGALSNSTFIAIAPDANASACVSPSFTAAQLQGFDQGKTYTTGYFGLSQYSLTLPTFGSVKQNAASGAFSQITGLKLSSGSAQASPVTTTGACVVTHTVTSQGSGGGGGTVTNLDAGSITLNGPSGSSITNLAFKQDPASNAYLLTLASEGLPSIPGVPAGVGTIVAGTYTVSGAGGKDVGKFSASLNVGAPLTITGGLPSTVTRSAGLTLNWTGGLSSDLVVISGGSSTTTGTGAGATIDSWAFTCTTTAGPGTFTVPASILTQMPAAALNSNGSGGGTLSIVSTPNSAIGNNGLFSAPLTAGGSTDYGLFFALVGTSAQVSYQ